jgi:hypothetical protein
MLSLTRHLLALRRELSALSEGHYEPVGESIPEDCLAYVRRPGRGSACLVALNFSSEERERRVPDRGKGRVLVSTLLDREGATRLDPFRLRANEGCVVEF